MSGGAGTAPPGVPAGLVAAIEEVLRAFRIPVRRRILLEELDRRGHRVSLAGLNRALQALRDSGRTLESEAGVRLAPGSARPDDVPRGELR